MIAGLLSRSLTLHFVTPPFRARNVQGISSWKASSMAVPSSSAMSYEASPPPSQLWFCPIVLVGGCGRRTAQQKSTTTTTTMCTSVVPWFCLNATRCDHCKPTSPSQLWFCPIVLEGGCGRAPLRCKCGFAQLR